MKLLGIISNNSSPCIICKLLKVHVETLGLAKEKVAHYSFHILNFSGPFWKQSPNYDYANAELQSSGTNFGPLPAPPQYPNGGMQYGNGQTYGNGNGYQYRGYANNMQGSPQQSSPSQGGLPLVPQNQPQYPPVNNNNNYNLPSNSQQQQQQQIYYNSNPSQGISNNGAMAPVSNQASAQPSNSKKSYSKHKDMRLLH